MYNIYSLFIIYLFSYNVQTFIRKDNLLVYSKVYSIIEFYGPHRKSFHKALPNITY